MKALIISLFPLLLGSWLMGQSDKRPVYIPNHADVESVDAIIAALYGVISGPAGPREWDRLRFLCKPDVQFNAMAFDGKGNERFRKMTLDDYIEGAGGYFLTTGFYETEIGRQSQGYRNVVQVLSTFATRSAPDGPIVAQGVNSIQLVFDDQRWWVVNILWNNCPAGEEMPKRLLRRKSQLD